LKFTDVAHIFGLHLSAEIVIYYFGKKWVGLCLGRFFWQTHLVTLRRKKNLGGAKNAAGIEKPLENVNNVYIPRPR
jgi:hypothetical protein